MAETWWPDPLDPKRQEEGDQAPTWSDYGLATTAGAVDVAGSVAGAVEYATGGETGGGFRRGAEAVSTAVLEGLTPQGSRALSAEFLPGEGDVGVTDVGIGRSLGIKSASAIPSLITLLVPAGLAGRLATGMGASRGTAAAVAGGTARVGEGTMNAGGTAGEIYAAIEALSDEELEEIPVYSGLLASGMSPAEARQEYMDQVAGYMPGIVGGISMLTGGMESMAARRLAGASAKGGIVRGALTGAKREGIEETLQSGGQAVGVQEALVSAGLAEEDWLDALSQTVEGTALGVSLGGPVGAATGIGSKPKPKVQAINPNPTTATTQQPATPQAAAPTPEQAAVSPAPQAAPGVAAPPANVAVGDPQNKPVRSGKKNEKKAKVAGSTTVQQVDGPVDAAQAAALTPTPAPAPAPTPATAQEVPAPAAPAPAAPAPTPVAAPALDQLGQVQPEPPALDQLGPVTPEPQAAPTASPTPSTGAPGPRILPALDPIARWSEEQTYYDNEEVQGNLKDIKKQEAGPQGKNWTKPQREARAALNAGATEVVGAYEPQPVEASYVEKGGKSNVARAAILSRVRKMVEDAKGKGLQFPSNLREATDADMALNDAAFLLMEAKRLAGLAKPKKDDFDRFIAREQAIRSGNADEARAARRSEGDQAKRQDQGSPADMAATSENAWTEEQAERREADEDDFNIAASDTGGVDATPSGEAAIDTQEERVAVRATKSKRGARIDDKTEKKEISGLDGPVDVAKAASDVRKVELSDEEKQRYVQMLAGNVAKAEAKKNMPANPDVPDEPKKAKSATKGEEIKAKAKAKPKPKPATKGDELKTRIKEAAAKTERNPSEAQKKAGNYPKGKLSVQGLPVTLETPKGGTRRGTDPSGREWSVKMPVNYGYINRTKGADGDQVDVYVGPNPDSDFVMLIDQKNLEDGSFDEHKVLIGFKNAIQAAEAYEDSFSDGRGRERVGDVRPMTMAEFKEWLKGDTTAPAGANAEAAALEAEVDAHIAGTLPEDFDLEGGFHPLFSSLEGLKGAAAASGMRLDEYIEHYADLNITVKELLEKNYDVLNATPLYNVLHKKLVSAVGDNIVSFVGQEWMRPFTGPSQADGLYYRPLDKVIIDYNIITHDEITPDNEVEFAEAQRHAALVIVHEIVHAATIKGLEGNPKLIAAIEDIMGDVASEYPLSVRQYGFTNPFEFVAEAMSNTEFQAFLSATPISLNTARKLNLKNWQQFTTWDGVIEVIRRILQIPQGLTSALEAITLVTEHSMFARDPESANLYADRMGKARREGMAAKFMAMRNGTKPMDGVHARVRDTIAARLPESLRPDDTVLADRNGTPWLLKARGVDQIAQLAKGYGKGIAKAARAVSDGLEMRRVRAETKLRETEPLVARFIEMQKKYAGQVWEDFSSLVIDETMAGVYADRPLDQQKHLGKNALKGIWPKAQHAELAAKYAKLPAELRVLRHDGMAFFQERQNEMNFDILVNRMKLMGHDDAALAKRVFDEEYTEADEKLLGDDLETLLDVGELAKINGPYFPLIREGDYVVEGTYVVPDPTNAVRQIEENVWEFNDRKAMEAYVNSLPTRPTVRSRWVDKNTGERFFATPEGNVPVTKQDNDAEQRFRVIVQNRHVEFFKTERDARAAEAAYAKDPAFKEVKAAQERRWEPSDRSVDMLSSQMQRMLSGLQKRETYRSLSGLQQNELVQSMKVASIQFLGATRIQSRRLPRTYVEGASKDLTSSLYTYAKSSSGYIAKLETQPALDKAMKDLDASVNGDSTDYGKENTAGRRVIANELKRRVEKSSALDDPGRLGEWTNRLATLAFTRFLASPAYSMVNAMQTIMLTYPQLAARYGPGRAASMMFQVYNDIGALNVAKKGAQATLAKATNPKADVSFVEEIKSRLKDKDERALIDYLVARGTIGLDAGFEVARMITSKDGVTGKLDTGLGYMNDIARQMPRAVEAINRTVSALSAYRMELARTGDVEAATLYAQEVTNLTQGLYSHTDAPAFFNHPLGRISLQFKKYGQLVYGLLGHTIGKAIRNAEPGDRAEAVKALAITAGAHVLMAGALGLPTEPIKYLVVAANAVGVTELSWDDVENYQRQIAADVFGQGLGEVVARGAPRALGFDLSSRVGMQDLLTFDTPDSDDPKDIKAFIGELVGGAPGSMVFDTLNGANKIISGDIAGGMEKVAPVKLLANSIKAYRQATEGKVSAAGYQTLDPYSMTETMIRVFGLTPAREAESQERRSYFYSAQKRQSAERNDWMHKWVSASPGERMRLWGQVEKWNQGRARDERLTRSELESYKKRRTSENRRGTVKDGFRVNRRDKQLYEGTLNTYNIR